MEGPYERKAKVPAWNSWPVKISSILHDGVYILNQCPLHGVGFQIDRSYQEIDYKIIYLSWPAGQKSKQPLPWSFGKKYPGRVLYGSLPAGLFLIYLCLGCQKKVKPREIPLAAKLFSSWVPVPLSFLDLAFFFSFTHGEMISSGCWLTS